MLIAKSSITGIRTTGKWITPVRSGRPQNSCWRAPPCTWCTGRHVSGSGSLNVGWYQKAHLCHPVCPSTHCGSYRTGENKINAEDKQRQCRTQPWLWVISLTCVSARSPQSAESGAAGPSRASAHRCKSRPPAHVRPSRLISVDFGRPTGLEICWTHPGLLPARAAHWARLRRTEGSPSSWSEAASPSPRSCCSPRWSSSHSWSSQTGSLPPVAAQASPVLWGWCPRMG